MDKGSCVDESYRRMLAALPDDRLRHMRGVAWRMGVFAERLGKSEETRRVWELLGFLGDVGYVWCGGMEAMEANRGHAKIGGEVLRQAGYMMSGNVREHGEIPGEVGMSLLTALLNLADMSVSPDGVPVSVGWRLEDIERRFGDGEVLWRAEEVVRASVGAVESCGEDVSVLWGEGSPEGSREGSGKA